MWGQHFIWAHPDGKWEIRAGKEPWKKLPGHLFRVFKIFWASGLISRYYPVLEHMWALTWTTSLFMIIQALVTSCRCWDLGCWDWRGENTTASTELLLQPMLVGAMQQDKAAEELHVSWCGHGKSVGGKKRGKKSIKKSSPIFPTRVSTESARHWDRGFMCNVCAMSQRQRCKEAAMKQNIFTDVAFSLHQLESVTRLLLYFVAEKWRRTFWLLHSWSSRQISEQRCSEQRAALGLVYEESTRDQYWAEKLPSELWFI